MPSPLLLAVSFPAQPHLPESCVFSVCAGLLGRVLLWNLNSLPVLEGGEQGCVLGGKAWIGSTHCAFWQSSS